jgi:surface antigen
MLLGVPIGATSASAHSYYYGHSTHYAHHAYARGYGRLQCVTFARSDSGVEIKGNAGTWWYQAAGVYQRGQRPESGSVLSFSSTWRMRLGHVAVVARVVNAREIEIDQANWWGPGSYGGVTRNVPVVDVSENNDWTAVRVALGDGRFGSVYPTHGFIYDRPDNGKVEVAAATTAKPAPIPDLNPAPADLRPRVQVAAQIARDGIVMTGPISYDEVAEAPDDGTPASSGHHWRAVHHHLTQRTTHSKVAARHWSTTHRS